VLRRFFGCAMSAAAPVRPAAFATLGIAFRILPYCATVLRNADPSIFAAEGGIAAALFTAARGTARLGLRIEQRLRDRDAALAVERGVMDLGVETDLSALQAVDHRELPEGAVTIERPLVQALDGVLKLSLSARCGKRDVLDVVIEIDALCRYPERAGDIQGHDAQHTRENGRQVNALRDVGADRRIGIASCRRPIEQHQTPDMHRRVGRLELQEQRVQRAEMLHRARVKNPRRPDVK
jgi:hypothetical protein